MLACVGDEASQGFTAPPTKEEYLASCTNGLCKRSEVGCTGGFECEIDLFTAYKTRDVMQCLKEAESCSVNCEDRVAEVKYSKSAGDMFLACSKAAKKCKGFNCPQALRLYRDDLLKDLQSCYDAGCDSDEFAVAKCLNVTAFAKAPKCATSCCTGGKFYACPSDTIADACFKGDASACTPIESRDALCAP